jgi:hypothetical protein
MKSTEDGGMPMPDWAKKEDREGLGQLLKDASPGGSFKVLEFNRVSDYPRFFAEWVQRDDTHIVHLFPRANAEDQWTMGHYVNRCAQCRSEVPMNIAGKKPCPRCGYTGLVYVPGRVEGQAPVNFPHADVMTAVKSALDKSFLGNVAVENIPEIGALALQFQGTEDMAPEKFLVPFFQAFHEELQP